MASGFKSDEGPITDRPDNEIEQMKGTSALSAVVQSSSANKKENKEKKLVDSSHGLRFESKLLTLFCLRGLGAGYKFELSKEKEDEGGKLEDLIFRYEVLDNTPTGKHWRYRFVQAKHKENEEEKIAADHLIVYNRKGDFSLPKYFHSFYKIKARGEDIHDCVICTNIGFNMASLEKGGNLDGKKVKIELVSVNDQPENILEFDAKEKTARYKLKISDENWRKKLKEEWSPVQLLAEELKDCATKNKTTDIRAGMHNFYHVALVEEHVIDCTNKKFHLEFVTDAEFLSQGAKELRQTISKLSENDEWKSWKFKLNNNFGKRQSTEVKNRLPDKVTGKDIDDFLDKLIFVVDMPNETQFKQIIETEDVSKYYQSDICDIQTIRVFDKISAAFQNKAANVWLTSEEGKKILLQDVTDVLEKYKKHLETKVGFNEDVIKTMAEELRQFMNPTSGNNKVQLITTPSPQHTAVKAISAVQFLLRELEQEGNYLMTPSSLLQDEEEKERWGNILKLQKGIHHFLVVVCDNEVQDKNYENFMPDNRDNNNFIISISHDDAPIAIKDQIRYTDLNENSQNAILSKIVSFQGKNLTVRELVRNQSEEIIDFRSIKELLFEEKEVKIPSFNTSSFEQSLFIPRRLRFPFDSTFELGGECRISSNGHIEWLVEEEERKETWKKIKESIDDQSASSVIYEDNHVIPLNENEGNGQENEPSMVVISGVAGSGKSTLLSHYYKEIKRAKPENWVIRINLLDHNEAILNLAQITHLEAVDFLINRLNVVVNKSSFSRSLLKNRLEKGDGIVVMFDGFDEVNELCQKGAIHLMKAITTKKSIQLYVTTRPHMVDDLQIQLSQLAYSLENFTENDQIDCLTSYWKNELKLSGDNEEFLQQFAKSLVDRVSETLKDEDKSFIGVPLQCRILAECFQSNVKEFIAQKSDEEHAGLKNVAKTISTLLKGQKFDLISLYNLLMDTKRRVFREEKASATNSNQIVIDAINRLIKDIEVHLTKFAIETIVTDQKIIEVLWPCQSSHGSNEDVINEEDRITSNGLKFGLTYKSGDETKINFLHRTYAEYLFARYLYKAFLLDDKRHNKLLENESVSKLIVNKILARPEYDGVQVFFNSMLKELVNDDEWRSRVKRRDLPDRLKKFTKNLFTQFLRQFPPLHKLGAYILQIESYYVNALHFSLSNGRGKIFEFLCDCLDATFEKQQVQQAMLISFIPQHKYFSLTFFLGKGNELFERFIKYFDDNVNCDVYNIISKFSSTNATYPCGLPPCGLEYSQWNGEDQQEMVFSLLQFLDNQREAFDKYFGPFREIDIVPMLTFLIFHENYESHLKFFLRLLSRSTHYSDDSKFATLLKKSFCSKEHFTPRRMEKVLNILRELEKENLIIHLQPIILAIEPETLKNIHQPLPLSQEDVKEMDMNALMKRDRYGMTRLHGAAFHGNTEAVDEIFEKIRPNLVQENETEQIEKMLVEDEYGMTPFYVAAARGEEEICRKMLIFSKEKLMGEKRFVRYALSQAIESENVKMFQLILNGIKRELGQKYLIGLLKEKPDSSSSLFAECRTKELFNAMAKIVVTRDDNVMDHTDLHELVFDDDATIRSLQYINEENFQGLLLKGVDDFTKRFLDTQFMISNAFQQMSKHILQHFSKNQLEQFVDTIISRNNTKKITRPHNITVFQERAENFVTCIIDEGWTREEVVLNDNGDGTTTIYAERTVPFCYWEEFIKSALNAYRNDFISREDVYSIFDCLKFVGDNSAKKLLLHEDDNGFIMIQSSQRIVKLMLTHLSKESQEEVKQQWKDNAPPMNSFFNWTFTESIPKGFAGYCSDILRFYLNYASDAHLIGFVSVVTEIHNINRVQLSVWSHVFENCDKEETNEIVKLAMEKEDILGRDDVKKLLFHEINQVPFIIKAVSWGGDVDFWLEAVPNEIKKEIQRLLNINATEFIEKAFCDLKVLFEICKKQNYKILNTFTFFLNYIDESQLEQFIPNITSTVDGENAYSIWTELLTHQCKDHKTDDIAKMDKFMKCVADKLGSNAVKELVLHQNGEMRVIFYPALRGEEKMLEAMLNYLSAKDRKKVQRQVDEFLDETYKMDGNWIPNYRSFF